MVSSGNIPECSPTTEIWRRASRRWLDFVGAGVNLFSVIPFAGDGASAIAKTVKFTRRVPSKAGQSLRMLMNIDELPRAAKIRLLEEAVDGGLDRLRRAGLDDDTAIRLVAKGVDPKLLDEAVQGARRVTSGGGFVDWRAGENALRSSTGGVKQGFPPRPKQPGTRGYGMSMPSTRRPALRARRRPVSRSSRRSSSVRSTRTSHCWHRDV